MPGGLVALQALHLFQPHPLNQPLAVGNVISCKVVVAVLALAVDVGFHESRVRCRPDRAVMPRIEGVGFTSQGLSTGDAGLACVPCPYEGVESDLSLLDQLGLGLEGLQLLARFLA